MASAPENHEFEALLDYLRQTRGFDFTAYKRPSLMRRIQKRMMASGVTNFEAYIDYLEVHPAEVAELFDSILINVTSFFRDRAAWSFLATECIPSILARRGAHQPIRIWSAGAASGEEAYSLVMLFAEAIGVEAVRERLKIYATDMDEKALADARLASYRARDLESVPPELVEKCFDRVGDRRVVHKDLRRVVIFGRHDLTCDAPISRIDLLVCRNTLMYFNAESQARILSRFHFALNEGGFLFLGKAETLLTHMTMFKPVDLRYRIFLKAARAEVRDRVAPTPSPSEMTERNRLRDAASDNTPIAHLVFNQMGELVTVNHRARSLFGLTQADVGRPIQDLEISYRPTDLRSMIDHATSERRTVTAREVEWFRPGGQIQYFDIEVVPVLDGGGKVLGLSVSFTDVTVARSLQVELQQSNQELETTLEELQSTNEELETTNEELQCTVEELETTNEELHSTNEELETLNAERASMNEDLMSVNNELRQRGAALKASNASLEYVLSGLSAAVIVADSDLHVLLCNPKAETTLGIRCADVIGRHLFNLASNFASDALLQPIRLCLSGERPHYSTSIDIADKEGRSSPYKVTLSALPQPSAEMMSGGAAKPSNDGKKSSAAAAAHPVQTESTAGKSPEGRNDSDGRNRTESDSEWEPGGVIIFMEEV